MVAQTTIQRDSHFQPASFFLLIGSPVARKFSCTPELAFKLVFLLDRPQPKRAQAIEGSKKLGSAIFLRAEKNLNDVASTDFSHIHLARRATNHLTLTLNVRLRVRRDISHCQ
jgi:hypothetical protein